MYEVSHCSDAPCDFALMESPVMYPLLKPDIDINRNPTVDMIDSSASHYFVEKIPSAYFTFSEGVKL